MLHVLVFVKPPQACLTVESLAPTTLLETSVAMTLVDGSPGTLEPLTLDLPDTCNLVAESSVSRTNAVEASAGFG